MVRSIGAQLGLLAFAAAIIVGLHAGNSPTTILVRALIVMLAACAAGQSVGWAAKQVLRDHLQLKKLAIDREHYRAFHEADGQASEGTAAAQSQPARAG
jgi:creatinine amidohydrolase/Fe(II)-dependent formamide hydrolase-like protein